MKVCKICNRQFENNRSLGIHIKCTHKMNTKEYYDEFCKQVNEDLCNYCNENETTFSGLTKGYNCYCSRRCMSLDKVDQRKQTKKERYGDENYNNVDQMKETKKDRHDTENFVNIEKAKQTNLERRGVEWTVQDSNVKVKIERTKEEKYDNPKFVNPEKANETCQSLYGVDNPFQCEEFKGKSLQTKLEKYGDENFNNTEKRKETCLEKYGVESYSESEEGRNKIKEAWNNKTGEEIEEANTKRESTCLERYGVEHVSQDPEIAEKQEEGFKKSYKLHDYQLPSGQWIRLQGYEPQALDILFQSYKEEDIFHKKTDMPEIWYTTEDNTEHRYYPDFYIPKDNLIVEVKSTFTYDYQREINELKRQATEERDFRFELVII